MGNRQQASYSIGGAVATSMGVLEAMRHAADDCLDCNNSRRDNHAGMMLSEARVIVAELIEAARLAEFHFAQYSEARYTGEKAHSLKYLKGEMAQLRAALARVGGAA